MRRIVSLSLLAIATASAPVSAADWPQWRGPDRDGLQPAFSAPPKWPAALTKVWATPVGTGHAAPVVAGDDVFVHTRDGEEEVVRCLDLKSGKEKWASRYPAPYEMNSAARRHGKGPKSTPAIGNGSLLTLGINGILSCWEADSGKLRWQKEFSSEFKTTAPLYGTATSPLIEGERCVAFVGGHDKGALRCFDLRSGRIVWSWDGDGPGYSSPIVIERAGTRQLVTQSQTLSIGLDARTGKLLWKIPFTTNYDQNIITPTVFGDRLIFSGVGRGTSALVLAERPDSQPKEVWHNQEVSFYLSSPVLVGSRLFGLSNRRRGELVCLDPATGKVLWTGPSRLGDNASLVGAGEVLLVSTTQADLLVVNATADSFQELARYKVAPTPTWAHVAVLEGRLLLKDSDTVVLWSLSAAE